MPLPRFVAAFALVAASTCLAAAPDGSFTPDSATVQRYGTGYRYPQAGWIVLHIEGSPHERGVQHGRLMAPEILGYLNCYANMQSPTAPTDGWRLTRTLVNASFLRSFDPEYIEEMQGIADGASAAGARFDNRPLDLIDIAAINLWAEIMTLDGAADANPTGLEGKVFPDAAPAPAKPEKEGHCSAFAATGKATKDGHPIIGHITMFGLYPSGFFNVWLDVKPDHGHRVLMQSYPGGIYSGMDYYLNDAGIAMVETTINQTRFDHTGTALASRVRKALQYDETIDAVVKTLTENGNGLYTNEWLLADMNTDEIAMFELGTKTSKLWRSSKNEWFAGTEGFYFGCNNAKDLTVRLETIPSVNDRPANMVWHPSDRDQKWMELYRANFGKMDEQFAKTAFTTAPLCGSPSVDAKFTTGSMAKHMQSWGTFGPPLGQTWIAKPDEIEKYKHVNPLVSNPWTILGPGIGSPDNAATGSLAKAIDLNDPASDHLLSAVDPDAKEDQPPTKPAWHGTILPATDGDLWLASSFAEYEQMVSQERGYAACQPAHCLCAADYDKVATSLFAARARYFAGVRQSGDVALAKIKWDAASDAWFKIASGKGVLVLAELRRCMGDDAFVSMMDAFGRAHAGKPASTADFLSAASIAAKHDLRSFFHSWIDEPGLPRLELASAETSNSLSDSSPAVVKGVLKATGGPLPSKIEVTLEHGQDEVTQVVAINPGTGAFEIASPHAVNRIVVDKYARAARSNGGTADLGSFTDDIGHTLIVYGTVDDATANRNAAIDCQKAIRASWQNTTVPVISDADVKDADLARNHIILIGRPVTNAISRRFASALPATFGPASFTARNHIYANSGSTLLAAGVNPLNKELSINIIAGNSALATVMHADSIAGHGHGPEVRILEASGKETSLVIPAAELVKSFDAPIKHQHDE